MRFACLVNTRSGGRKGLEFIKRLRDFESDTHQLEVFEANSQDALRLSERLAYCDRILIAGGDGTISSFLNAIPDFQLPICILPLGTGNDLARQLDIPGSTIVEALPDLFDFYADLPSFPLSVWRLSWQGGQQSRLFVNYASFGFDGDVVKGFHDLREWFAGLPNFLGRTRNRIYYFLSGIRSLHTPPAVIEHLTRGQSEVIFKGKLRTLFFSNISSVMGMAYFRPASDPADKLLEARCILSALSYLLLPTGTCRTHQAVESASKWDFQFSKEVLFQVDGEDYSKFAAKTFSIEYSGSRNFCGRRIGPAA